VRQEMQRFGITMTSMSTNAPSEEREEYEPHIDNGVIVYAGVDLRKDFARR